MIIWTLALVLFACLGVAGYSFGAIRASASFFGILISLLLAKIFGHMLQPLLGSVGFKNPITAWVVAPFVVFVIGLSIFKIVGFYLHKKVDVYYKYKAGDLRMALWLRLNARLGLCVGLLNATVYLILISMVIYVMSQATYQLTAGDTAKWSVKMLNSAGKQLQSSGMAKVAAAIDPMPTVFYEAVDMMGLLYANPLLEARLGRYPAFLTMGEKPEFQAIGGSREFTEMWQRQAPVADILNDPLMTEVVKPESLKEIWAVVQPNLRDLDAFLRTGVSKTYEGDPLLGRWEFNLNAAIGAVRVAKPTISAGEMRTVRLIMTRMFGKTTLVATPEKTLFVKNIGRLRPPPATAPGGAPRGAAPPPARGGRGGAAPRGAPPAAAPPVAAPVIEVDIDPVVQGKWDGGGANYRLTFGRGSYDSTVEGDKLVVNGFSYPMVFDRQY